MKYAIEITTTISAVYVIEASDDEEAKVKAFDQYLESCIYGARYGEIAEQSEITVTEAVEKTKE